MRIKTCPIRLGRKVNIHLVASCRSIEKFHQGKSLLKKDEPLSSSLFFLENICLVTCVYVVMDTTKLGTEEHKRLTLRQEHHPLAAGPDDVVHLASDLLQGQVCCL